MSNKKRQRKKAGGKPLQGMSPQTQDNLKKSAVHVGKEILFGTVMGAAAGAIAGRSSLVVGAIITGIGHYHGSTGVSMFGAGMMASGGYQTGQTLLSGSEAEQEPIEGIKERLSTFKEGFLKRLWLDKLKKAKAKKEKDMSGTEEVQYFTYPDKKETVGELDMSGLDAIEEELGESAAQFSIENSLATEEEPIY